MNSVRRLVRKYEDFLKFSVVGAANTLVDFAVYTVLYLLGVPFRVAQVFSYAAGTLNSYILNKSWTFKAAAQGSAVGISDSGDASDRPVGAERKRASSGRARRDWAQAARFLTVNLITLGVSIVLLGLIKERLGVNALIAKALVTVVTTLLNFVGSKLWGFRSGSPSGLKEGLVGRSGHSPD